MMQAIRYYTSTARKVAYVLENRGELHTWDAYIPHATCISSSGGKYGEGKGIIKTEGYIYIYTCRPLTVARHLSCNDHKQPTHAVTTGYTALIIQTSKPHEQVIHPEQDIRTPRPPLNRTNSLRHYLALMTISHTPGRSYRGKRQRSQTFLP